MTRIADSRTTCPEGLHLASSPVLVCWIRGSYHDCDATEEEPDSEQPATPPVVEDTPNSGGCQTDKISALVYASDRHHDYPEQSQSNER